jgi:hypothetical protein
MNPSVRSPAMNSLRIRPMRPDEISIAVNGATAEGWNLGLADDACFAAAIRKASSSASSKALWPRSSPASITVRVSRSSISTPCERICAGAGTAAHIKCGHRARWPTRDRARWRAGAAAELPVMRSRVDPTSPEACRLGRRWRLSALQSPPGWERASFAYQSA